MLQNTFIRNRANEVELVFTNVDFNLASKVGFRLDSWKKGNEKNTVDDPQFIRVVNATTLALKNNYDDDPFSTLEGKTNIEVIYYDNQDNLLGLVILNGSISDLAKVNVESNDSLLTTSSAIAVGNTIAQGYIISFADAIAYIDSYIDERTYLAYCMKKGLPCGDTVHERCRELLVAMDYIAKYEDRFQGIRTFEGQLHSFPRKGVCLLGYEIQEDLIPDVLIFAQMELASFSNSNELFPSDSDEGIIKEKIDVIEVTYKNSGKRNIPKPRRAMEYLKKLFKNSNELLRG